MRFIDLSHKIEASMPVYPGDRAVSLALSKAYEKDGYNYSVLSCGVHLGTHADAPSHLTADKTRICDIPLSRFCGTGRLFDVRGKAVIEANTEYREIIQRDDIVLIFTGHDSCYGSEAYYQEHPVLSEGFARLLIEKGVKAVGMDTPSPDRFPFPVHKALLGSGILLLENLTNLGALLGVEAFEVSAFPLRIDAEGSPMRVVARI